MVLTIESSVFLQTLEKALTCLNAADEKFSRSHNIQNRQDLLFQQAILELEYEIPTAIRMGKAFQESLLLSVSSPDKDEILKAQEKIRIIIVHVFHTFKYWADRWEAELATQHILPGNLPGVYPPDTNFNPLLLPEGYFSLEELSSAEKLIQERRLTQDWPIFGMNHLKVCMFLMLQLMEQMAHLERTYENRDRTYTTEEIRWSLLELKKQIYTLDGSLLINHARFWYYPIRMLGEMRKYGFTETNYRKAIKVLNTVWALQLDIHVKDYTLQQESTRFGNNHTTCHTWKQGDMKDVDWMRVVSIRKEFLLLLNLAPGK